VLPLTQEALAQLLGVRRTTVTPTMSKLRAAGAIRSDRRGFVEIDRARLDSVACECYAPMQRRIDRMLPGIVRAATCRCAVPGKPHRPFQ